MDSVIGTGLYITHLYSSSSGSYGKNNNEVKEDSDQGSKRKNQAQKSNTYIEKRRKNNEAAKRSREKKRKREGLLEQKVKDLKTENEKLIA